MLVAERLGARDRVAGEQDVGGVIGRRIPSASRCDGAEDAVGRDAARRHRTGTTSGWPAGLEGAGPARSRWRSWRGRAGRGRPRRRAAAAGAAGQDESTVAWPRDGRVRCILGMRHITRSRLLWGRGASDARATRMATGSGTASAPALATGPKPGGVDLRDRQAVLLDDPVRRLAERRGVDEAGVLSGRRAMLKVAEPTACRWRDLLGHGERGADDVEGALAGEDEDVLVGDLGRAVGVVLAALRRGRSGRRRSTVTKTSTDWPAWSRPPTARSSETVREIARQASESGLTDSSGPRIENWPPSADEASMLVVTSWPCRIETAGIRPMTSPGRSRRRGVGRVERHLADLDVRGLDGLAGRDDRGWRPRRPDLLGLPGLAGLLLGLVDQEERRAARDQRPGPRRRR